MRQVGRVAGVVGVLGMSSVAMAQFGTPTSTPVREKIVGTFVSSEGGVVPAGGDQIGAFFQNKVVGVFEFDSSGVDFEVTIYGDDPATEGKDGPAVGDRVTFKLYDVSTNEEIDLEPINSNGEKVNLTYRGQEVPELPIELPGLDLTPSRQFDLRVGTDSGGGGDGDGEGAGYDVNGDGKIDTEDAAMVLRAVMRGGEASGAEDVNGDGSVTTADAIEVLRNRS